MVGLKKSFEIKLSCLKSKVSACRVMFDKDSSYVQICNSKKLETQSYKFHDFLSNQEKLSCTKQIDFEKESNGSLG